MLKIQSNCDKIQSINSKHKYRSKKRKKKEGKMRSGQSWEQEISIISERPSHKGQTLQILFCLNQLNPQNIQLSHKRSKGASKHSYWKSCNQRHLAALTQIVWRWFVKILSDNCMHKVQTTSNIQFHIILGIEIQKNCHWTKISVQWW